ncbi:polyprenyl synthetase family protein [Metabacillus herbersteinensis]
MNLANKELSDIITAFVNERKGVYFGQLTYIHYKVFGGQESEILSLAAAVELLVLSFDMFDDFEDLDNLEEPWMKIDRSIALNAATTIFTISQKMVHQLSSAAKIHIHEKFLHYSLQAMQGQHDDLQNQTSTEKECLNLMKLKSGSLIALASVCGMLLANKAHPEVEQYSLQVGIAAQTENDYRDLFNLDKNDLSAKKKTLAFLYLQKGFNEHCIEIAHYFDSGHHFNHYFKSKKEFKEKLVQTGVIHYLNVIKQIAIKKAARLIEELPLEKYQIETLKSHLIINEKTKNEER